MVVLNKEYSIDELINSIIKVDKKIIVDFLVSNNITFNRELRIEVLREQLRPFIVRTRQESLLLDTRLNYRLLWFNIFAEEQLDFFVPHFDDEEFYCNYVYNFYSMLFKEIEKLNLDKKLLKEFTNLIFNSQISIESDSTVEFNHAFDSCFIDDKNYIDGLRYDDFRSIMYNSATIEQLASVGEKYGVDVVVNMKKNDLAHYIIHNLNLRKLDNVMTVDELLELSVPNIKQYSIDNGFEVTSVLTKMQVIEHILQHTETTKEDYTLPVNDSVYQMAIPLSEDERVYDELILERDNILRELIIIKSGYDALSSEQKREADEKIKLLEEQKEQKDHEIEELKENINTKTDNNADLEKLLEEKNNKIKELEEEIDELRNREPEVVYTPVSVDSNNTSNNTSNTVRETVYYADREEPKKLSFLSKLVIFFASLLGVGLVVLGIVLIVLLVLGII